jgi:hypothetical protein
MMPAAEPLEVDMAIPPRNPQSQERGKPALSPRTKAPASSADLPTRMVNPRQQYPKHFDHLMRDLYAAGLEPERWQVIGAEEIRLDEVRMDIEFTLMEQGTDNVRIRCVEMERGVLLRVRDGG